jgi:hypothetical protein
MLSDCGGSLRFMPFPLSRGRSAGADDSHRSSSIRMGYEQQPSTSGVTDREASPFTDGMVRVINCCSQRVIEHGHRFVEGDSVFQQVAPCLFAISLKLHVRIVMN